METKNYKLSLCNDSSINFIDWRKSINGLDDSNMIKIDTALMENATAVTELNANVEEAFFYMVDMLYTLDGTVKEIIDSKANLSSAINVTIKASDWTGDSAPFSQEIIVDGLSATSNGMISLSHSASSDQREAARNAMFSIAEQDDNKITIIADGDIPTIDIPALIIIFG